MMRWLLALVAILIPLSLHAQPADLSGDNVVAGGITQTLAQWMAPATFTGFGTLIAPNSSTALSTLTPGPNSPAWPSNLAVLNIINSPANCSTCLLYLCPLGGNCSASVGIPIAPGFGYPLYKPSVLMTVYAAVASTVVVAQW